MFLDNVQGLCTKTMPDVNIFSPYTWRHELTSITDMRRYEICWDVRTAMRCTPKNISTTCRTFQGLSGDAVQPRFFTQTVNEHGYAKELYYIGYTKYEHTTEDECVARGGLKLSRGRHAVHLLQPMDKDSDLNN